MFSDQSATEATSVVPRQLESKMVQLLTFVAALGAFGAAAGVPLPSSKGELLVGPESVEPMVHTLLLCRLNA